MKSVPPKPGPVRNLEYPEIPEASLGDGLKFLSIQDDSLPRSTLILALPGGRAHDPEDACGLTQLTLDMLKEGTARRGSREIAETLDRLAIDLSTEVSMEHGTVTITCLEHCFPAALALLGELLCEAEFPDEELSKLRTRWASILIARRADPSFLATESFYKGLFGTHAYAQLSPTPYHLQQIDRPRLQSFYARSLPPMGSLLLYAGPESFNESRAQVQRSLNGLLPVGTMKATIPAPAPYTGPSVRIVDRPGSVQTRLVVGRRSLPRAHPDYLRLKVANQVLGGGGSARLFLRLREEKGYTYGVYSSLRGYSMEGVFMAGCSVRSETASETVQEILDSILNLAGTPPGPKELERSKAELLGSFIRRMEVASSMGAIELNRRLAGLPDGYYQQFIPAIRQVTAGEVSAVTRRHLAGEEFCIVAVGDRTLLEPQLSRFGPVHAFDAQGVPMNSGTETCQ